MTRMRLFVGSLLLATATAGMAFAQQAAPAANVDQYGCNIDSQGKYRCYHGDTQGKVYNSQQEMLQATGRPIAPNVNENGTTVMTSGIHADDGVAVNSGAAVNTGAAVNGGVVAAPATVSPGAAAATSATSGVNGNVPPSAPLDSNNHRDRNGHTISQKTGIPVTRDSDGGAIIDSSGGGTAPHHDNPTK